MVKIARDSNVRNAFSKVKEDIEGLKNELAFTLRRIAQLENNLIKRDISAAISKSNSSVKKKKSQKKKKTSIKKTKQKKPVKITWNDHVGAVRRRYPKLTLKEALQVASRTWKKKKRASKKK